MDFRIVIDEEVSPQQQAQYRPDGLLPLGAGTPGYQPGQSPSASSSGVIGDDDVRSLLLGMGGTDSLTKDDDVRKLLEAMQPEKARDPRSALIDDPEIRSMLGDLQEMVTLSKQVQASIAAQQAEAEGLRKQMHDAFDANVRAQKFEEEKQRQLGAAGPRSFDVGEKDVVFDPRKEADRIIADALKASQAKMEALRDQGAVNAEIERLVPEVQVDAAATAATMVQQMLDNMRKQGQSVQALAQQALAKAAPWAEEAPQSRAERMVQERREGEERQREMREAMNRADPRQAALDDAGAGAALARQSGLAGAIPGGRTAAAVAGNAGQLGKLPEALGGLGEAGGLAAAAGPAGAALMVMQAASKEVADTLNGVRDNMKLLGDTVSDLARNQFGSVFERAVDAHTKSLEKIPVLGQVAAASFEASIQPLRSFTEVVSAFADRGRQLSGLDGSLATSTAMADVRSLFADIKEAQTLGPEMSRLIDAQSEFSEQLRDALLPIKEFLVEKLANTLETYGPMVLQQIKVAIALLEAMLRVMGDLTHGDFMAAFFDVAKAVGDIRRSTERRDVDDSTHSLLGSFNRLGSEVAPDPLGGGF